MEIGVSVAQPLADRATTVVVDGTLQQFRYILDYNENMSNLRDKLRDLQHAKARVGHKVEEATRGLDEIEGDVLSWISRADAAILKVESILAEDGAASKTCCAGRLPNFKNRYKLSKQAKVEAPVISELAEKGAKFDRVSYPVPLHHHVLPSNDYEPFGSRESTLNSIMDALRNRDADLIGVCGLGGVGKTTLAKEVGQRMKEEVVFQLVITVEVHPKADVKIIQERVAEWVEIKKAVESPELRAALLNKRLLQEKSILVILDDVWDAINLKKVGIPIDGDTNRCTVLVTTRDEAVISQMGVQKQKSFQLNVLKDDEAWGLFQKMVGDLPDDLHSVATQIVKRCGGLPILLLPVATTLKNKPLPTWEDALQRLESGLQKNGDGMQALAYSALELSCTHLGSDQKSLFLFCGLLPQFILIDDVVKYTVGLSLFKDCPTVKAIRSRVLTLLGDLKSSCLLMEGDNHKYFTMHDVVHSFVRGYRDDVFSPEDYSEVEDWPDKHALEQLTAISLRDCQLPRLPAMLECPKLKVFLFYRPPSIPGDIFLNAVEELRVLDISDVRLSPLPSLLRHLQSLQTLCLDRCIVEDVAMIGNMLQLKILSLIGANIVHLPEEIGKLAGLQVLDLGRCMELKKISPGVLSSLTHLEELYMGDSFTQWGSRDKTDGQQINADLAELKELKKLTTLEIGVTDVTSLPDDLFSDKLERFFIVIGDCWDWERNDDVSATLKVKLDARIRVLRKVNVLLKKADDLHLDNSVGVKDIINLPELNMEGFGDRLRNLRLQNFHEVRYLVNSVQRGSRIVFPRLELLVIENAQHLDKICNGPLAKESLGNLKQIKVSGCHALSNLFPLSVARCLSKLEDIEVTYCEKMEGIFIMDDKRADKDEKICLGLLQTLTLEHLPRLENILSSMTSQETREDAFFSDKIVFPNIEHVKVYSIKIRMMWNSEFSDSCTYMRNLVTLKIDGCKFIKDIFTVSMVNRLVQLQDLEIRNCPLLQEIIVPENHGEEENKMICLPKLKFLFLEQLHSLVTVCTGDLIECPKLIELRIKDCPRLKTFIRSSSHHRCGGSLFDSKVLFPNLKRMVVFSMDSLIKLWDEELHQDSFTKLKVLAVVKARSLTELFSSDMLRKVHTLERLTLRECDSLETIFNLRDLIRETGKYPQRISMLTNMTVTALPNLKHVWHGDPHRIFSFPCLRLMKFWNCRSLESLIPASIAQQLPQLECVRLMACTCLEQIIHREGIYEQQDIEEATFVFPRLERIEIWKAPRLSSFYPGQHTIDWPALKHMSITSCPKLEVFKSVLEIASQVPEEAQSDHLSSMSEPERSILESASSSDQQLQIMKKWESSVSQPLLSIEEVLTKLESVGLSNQQLQIQELELPDVLSSTLKEVHFHGFDGESANLPINFLERFPNLEKISVSFSDFVELFTCEILDEEKENMPLSRIQHLDLRKLTKLEHIWSPQSKLDHILNNLLTLRVSWCHSLIHLAPPFASFCNLTTLEVVGCQSLVSLFTFSTMTSLVELREMKVGRCEKLTEIIAISDEETEREAHICFYKLEILKLSKLGSITSFCSKNATLKFPLLAQLIVEDCPNMELFSSGYLSAPKLKTVQQGIDRWKGDLNTTIRQLYTESRLAAEEEEKALESSQP